MSHKKKSLRPGLRPGKPHGNSPLTRLDPGRADEIQAYLLTHTGRETVVWLRTAGLITSEAALSNWLARRRLESELNSGQAVVDAVMRRFEEKHPKWSKGRLQAVGQMFFTEMAIGRRNPEIWRITQQLRMAQENLATKRQTLALQERRVKLLEEKAAQSDKTKEIMAQPLTKEEQLARIKEVYGI